MIPFLFLATAILGRRAFICTTAMLSTPLRLSATDDPETLIASTDKLRRVRFYGPIDAKSLLSLNAILSKFDDESNDPIHLHIQSGGGELLPALYTADLIASIPSPVHTYVDGFCASAATLLAVCGQRRYMSRHSVVMVHELSSSYSGQYADLIQSTRNTEILMEQMLNIYNERTHMDEEQLRSLLSVDRYLDAPTCLKLGMIDRISTGHLDE